MHNSSQLTFFFKYIFFPLFLAGNTVAIILNLNKTDQVSYYFARGQLLMVGLAAFWLILMMIRLQNVEATEEYLTIRTFKKKKIVDYKDIEWISQLAMVNPPMISLKYFDVDTGKTRKILILLSKQARGFGFSTEAEMTTFIRERIIAAKPDYSKASEPNRWSAIIYILVTSIPIAIFSGYFFSRIH